VAFGEPLHALSAAFGEPLYAPNRYPHMMLPRHTAARVALTALLAVLLSCTAESPSAPDAGGDAGDASANDDASLDPCAALFGAPNENTGLDATQCRPVCGCTAATFIPRAWDVASLAALRATTQSDAPTDLRDDPYSVPAPAPRPDATVCATRFADATTYAVETFASIAEATAAGAVVTHAGACGVCSSLADLAVYAGTPDLTAPVRQCGLDHLGDFAGLVGCLEALGFTPPCAQIWAYNTEHTRAECGAVCLRLLRAPYHTADGALNDCLMCDEVQSGPVFKSVAGRTRRNSGLANAMCRPCSEVIPLAHRYPGI